MGTHFARAQSDGSCQIIQTVIVECCEVKLSADLLQHFFIVGGIGVGVISKHFLGDIVPFPVRNNAAGD